MTARSGLSVLIEELRGMTEAGTAEYTVGSTVYWSDDAMQIALDNHRQDVYFEQMRSNPFQGAGGTLNYLEYTTPLGDLEQTTGGTAVFFVQDSVGNNIGSALWTMDYRRGILTFGTTTHGTTLYATYRTYDLNAAASEIWQKKSAHYAPSTFDFSTDNHSIKRSQIYEHAIDQAKFFQGISRSAISTVDRFRGDVW
jgi:hypothetical protein